MLFQSVELYARYTYGFDCMTTQYCVVIDSRVAGHE